jgi:predicted site-specific integrase-resolvase
MTVVPARNLAACPVLLTAVQVSALFRVDVHTVRRWAKRGMLTPRASEPMRFAEHEVRALLAPEGGTS